MIDKNNFQNSISVEVGTWLNDESSKSSNNSILDENTAKKIKQDVVAAIKKYPKKIFLEGNYTRWFEAMKYDTNFAYACLESTFNFFNSSVDFYDESGNNQNILVYEANIFPNSNESKTDLLKSLVGQKFNSLSHFMDFLRTNNLPTENLEKLMAQYNPPVTYDKPKKQNSSKSR